MEIMDGKFVCCLNVLHSPSTTINNTHFSGIPLNEKRFTLNSKSINKFFSTKRNDGFVYQTVKFAGVLITDQQKDFKITHSPTIPSVSPSQAQLNLNILRFYLISTLFSVNFNKMPKVSRLGGKNLHRMYSQHRNNLRGILQAYIMMYSCNQKWFFYVNSDARLRN